MSSADSNVSSTPQGWLSLSLGDLLLGIEAGKSFTCQARPAEEREWGIIKVSAMTWGTFDESENKAIPTGKQFDLTKEIRSGDILLSRSNTAELVGATVLVGHCRSHLLLSDKSMRLLYPTALSARWLQRALASPQVRSQISKMANGTSDSMRNVSQQNVLAIELSIPPRSEQERIADALDELLSDLHAGIEALKSAQTKLQLYRASVLKAAVQGDLTAEWREEHSDVEPASVLLQRILKERRKRWEEEQLRKFNVNGKTPPANWRAKYTEPVAPDTSNLPSLPDAWCWATIDQCSHILQYGTSSKTTDEASGIPVLRMGNITSTGELKLDDFKFLPRTHDEFPSLLLEPGDLVFNRTNSAELVGKTALYAGSPSPCSFASYLIRIRLSPDVAPSIVLIALNGTMGRIWVKRVMNQTVGQANVNGTKLASFAFPLPPKAEQEVLVEAVDDQVSIIDYLDRGLATRKEEALILRQSTLRHAFTGQLVPQDQNDEPASELLMRIAVEREARAKAASAKSNPRKFAGRRSQKPPE